MLTLYFLFVAAGHAVSPGVLLAGYGLPLLFWLPTLLGFPLVPYLQGVSSHLADRS